jgi:superfamily I DNA and/or RNA helicase
MVNTSKVGFLDSLNRLNVALTRARNQLVIFGKKEFFKTQPYSTMLQKLAGDENPYYMILDLDKEVER